MKKIFFMMAVYGTAFMIMSFTFRGNNKNVPLHAAGAQPGYCGDPAGGSLNCTVCHFGPAAGTQSGWITSNIPSGGYVPNSTYTITATATRAGHTKFGFEISPQNSSGTFLGTLVNTSSETQLTSDPDYITHTSTGTSGNGSKTWTFNWTAPTSGSGSVTFYGAFNLTNSSRTSTGDTIMISTLTVPENTQANALSENHIQSGISVYPNPFSSSAILHSDIILKNATLMIYNSSGQTVKQLKNVSGQTVTLYRDNLPDGQYFLQLSQNNGIIIMDKLAIVE